MAVVDDVADRADLGDAEEDERRPFRHRRGDQYCRQVPGDGEDHG